MAELNPFDPPDSDPEAERARNRRVYIAPPLDPEERVRQGFQQLRIDDRRMDSPMNWLSQGPVIPTRLHPLESPYYTPEMPGYGSAFPPVDYRDVFNPLSVALGVKEINAATDRMIEERKRKRHEAEVK